MLAKLNLSLVYSDHLFDQPTYNFFFFFRSENLGQKIVIYLIDTLAHASFTRGKKKKKGNVFLSANTPNEEGHRQT